VKERRLRLFEFPMFIEKSMPLAQFFKAVHGTVWILLVLAVIGHVSVALYHHFILKNEVLKRMTGRTRNSSNF